MPRKELRGNKSRRRPGDGAQPWPAWVQDSPKGARLEAGPKLMVPDTFGAAWLRRLKLDYNGFATISRDGLAPRPAAPLLGLHLNVRAKCCRL